jgi:hypothetical protein
MFGLSRSMVITNARAMTFWLMLRAQKASIDRISRLWQAAALSWDGMKELLEQTEIFSVRSSIPVTKASLLTGTVRTDHYIGSRFNDVIDGGSGDDKLQGGAGDDILTGGAGDDTAIFSGNRADYTITRVADGKWSVKDTAAARDGTDTLSGVRFLKFADATTATPMRPPRLPGSHRRNSLLLQQRAPHSQAIKNPAKFLTLRAFLMVAEEGF